MTILTYILIGLCVGAVILVAGAVIACIEAMEE